MDKNLVRILSDFVCNLCARETILKEFTQKSPHYLSKVVGAFHIGLAIKLLWKLLPIQQMQLGRLLRYQQAFYGSLPRLP